MSMPSDVTPEISEAMDRLEAPLRPQTNRLTREQTGWAVAALVAFLGISYVGPAFTRLRRKPTTKELMAQRLRAARRQAQKTGDKARRRVRRLGGGTIWR